jgi:hypothetical protein
MENAWARQRRDFLARKAALLRCGQGRQQYRRFSCNQHVVVTNDAGYLLQFVRMVDKPSACRFFVDRHFLTAGSKLRQERTASFIAEQRRNKLPGYFPEPPCVFVLRSAYSCQMGMLSHTQCTLISRQFLVLPVRIELTTSPLPRECSTTELRQRHLRQIHSTKSRGSLPYGGPPRKRGTVGPLDRSIGVALHHNHSHP